MATSSDDVWLAKATAQAMTSARNLIKQVNSDKGVIAAGTPIGRLSETEWGWIVAAVIFGWISNRSEQAATEGVNLNTIINATGQTPDPWEIGALKTVLPKLGDMALPFDQPLSGWTKDQMVSLIGQAHQLVQQAYAGRDKEARSHPAPRADERTERQLNAATGGALMTHDEMNDEIPF